MQNPLWFRRYYLLDAALQLQEIWLGDVKPTTVKLQVAYRSYIFPKWEIENILVMVDKFIFPTEFIILDME